MIFQYLYTNILKKIHSKKLPDRLKRNGRPHIHTTQIKDTEKLYRSYSLNDIDKETGIIKLETIRFPDCSCNWSRFSKPPDIWYISNNKKNGCYFIKVKDARYKKIANPVHDELDDNYSHIEIRLLLDNEDFDFEPPQKGTNASKTNINITADPDSALNIDSSNSQVNSLVEYSSEGCGNITIKAKNVKRKIHTAKSKRSIELDDFQISANSPNTIIELIKGLL
jgi:hypothetical protein